MKPKEPFHGKLGKRIIVLQSEVVLHEVASNQRKMIEGTDERVRKQFKTLVNNLEKLKTQGEEGFTLAKTLVELTTLKQGFPEGKFNPRLANAESVQELIDLVEEMIQHRIRLSRRQLELAFEEEKRKILGTQK